MLRFLGIRLLRALLTLLLVVSFAFIVLRLSGDPALLIMSADAPPEAIAAFRRAWGLDDPLWVQYLRYFGAILHGDLGQSMRDGRSAIELVAERVPATLALTIPALLIKLCLGIPAGVYAALHRNSWIDRGVMFLAVAGFTGGELQLFEDPARDCADHPRVINDQTGSHGLARDGSERAPTRRTLLTIERIATICFTTPFGRQFRKGPLSPFQAFGLLPSVCARL